MIPQLQRETPVSTPPDTGSWSLATRIAFRFVFSYVVLYISPGPVGSLGAGTQITTGYRDMWQRIWHVVVPWFGANVLHVQGEIKEVANGSGDQLYDYVLIACLIVLAALATIVWSILDRKRTNYRVLYQWLRVFMRLSVGAAMIGYGMNKLFRMQFPPPPLARLVDTHGQTSPMGTLWTFMGASRLYSFAGGAGEMLGGLLIIVPRLTALGSLISLGMMGNVLLLNLCYDVPRKIYSIHLVLMCLFLLLPDFRRLTDVFILNRRAEPVYEGPLFKDKQFNLAALLLQFAFGISVIIVTGHQAYIDAVKAATHLPSPLRGIWAVDNFSRDGLLHPPMLTDTERWRYVIFDDADVLSIQPMDGSLRQYYLKLDPEQKAFKFAELGSKHWAGTFTITALNSDTMTMEGDMGGHTVSLSLRKDDLSDPSKYLLLNRGFHWVNPYAFRR